MVVYMIPVRPAPPPPVAEQSRVYLEAPAMGFYECLISGSCRKPSFRAQARAGVFFWARVKSQHQRLQTAVLGPMVIFDNDVFLHTLVPLQARSQLSEWSVQKGMAQVLQVLSRK